MNPAPDIEYWLHQQGHRPPFHAVTVSGGSICSSSHLSTADGQHYFIKSLDHPQATLFQAEAAGLAALADCHCIRTPGVYHYEERFLVLEYLAPAVPGENFWETLAEGLAALHRQMQPLFGFIMDNFCGATPQPNPPTSDGHQFFIEQRLLYQAGLQRANRLLSVQDMAALESICRRLPELVPAQPACLVHGDLWSGNVHCGPDGAPVLIDPACYWGWAETDIAMTKLFGGFPETFYHAYHQSHTLLPGWRERVDIYNIYHLLNHLNLFGASYYPQTLAALNKYR